MEDKFLTSMYDMLNGLGPKEKYEAALFNHDKYKKQLDAIPVSEYRAIHDARVEYNRALYALNRARSQRYE